MALIRFILILSVIYFVVRFVMRFVLRSFMKNAQQNFQNQQKPTDNKREGDVTINTKSDQGKKIDKDEGDYVDYEEVK